MDDFCDYCSSSNIRVSDVVKQNESFKEYTYHCRDCGEVWSEIEYQEELD